MVPQIQLREHWHNCCRGFCLWGRKHIFVSGSYSSNITYYYTAQNLCCLLWYWNTLVFLAYKELHELALVYGQPYFRCLPNTHPQMICTASSLHPSCSYPISKIPSCHGSKYLLSSKAQFESPPICGVSPGYSKLWWIKWVPWSQAFLGPTHCLFLICTMGIVLLLTSKDSHDGFTSWLKNTKFLSQCHIEFNKW